MKLRSLGVAVLGAVCMGAGFAPAAAVPVEVNCTSLLAIQTYNLGETATDQTYLLVNGTDVAGQQELKDGDQIEAAGVKLTFCILSGTK